ncbi:MAG: ATP-grasp domain-containing protein [Hyphomicrobiaceae bacterium]
MLTLTEDLAKSYLKGRGLPVPSGGAASSPAEAAALARKLGGEVVVKALVPTGRRGKAGAVLFATSPEATEAAAGKIIGGEIAGYAVERVYVEAKESIDAELYLAFVLESYPPMVLASRRGGVDIEDVHRDAPEEIIKREVDPATGLTPWAAAALWETAGIESARIPRLARLTAALWRAFVDGDALTLELNPIAVRPDGSLSLVGAMLGLDEAAVGRHPAWREAAQDSAMRAGRRANERELRVIAANDRIPGAVFRYTELDGDIGFVVGGGGASLFQHDLMLKMGAKPANHLDATPGAGWDEKMGAVIDAILDNPNVKGLLISYNFLQLIQVDDRMRRIARILEARKVDPTRFPIVVRLFGPADDEARRIAAGIPGLHYMPPESPLDAAVARIIELTGGPRPGVSL